MASLADLFNPSFFMFLGIMVLIVALLVVYFESKMRDQNHKIASMLSLVSTLAEDMNGMKMSLNHLAVSTLNGGSHTSNIPLNTPFPTQNLGSMHHNEKSNDLIEVSDDDDEEDDEDEEDEDEDEEDEDEEESINNLEDINDINETSSESLDEDDEVSSKDENVKVIKLNISQDESDNEKNVFELDNTDDLVDLEGDFETSDDIPEISEQYTEEILNLKYDEIKEEKSLAEGQALLEEHVVPADSLNESVSELKTITINLGDEFQSEHIDFKKLQLPKLRSIAVEKGLTSSSEAQKLKKPELLKLLGAE